MPEVRQSPDGAVAVRAGEDRWLVAHPEHGGHWTNDEEVSDWTPLAPQKSTAK